MTAAAEDIYLTYRDKVSGYIRGKVDNYHDAEDLTAQVFEKVYGKFHTFDGAKSSLSTWIYTVTRNTVTDYFRTRRIHASCDEVHELPAPETDRDVLEDLADALMTLPMRERDLILLHYYKGLTLKEVADRMGMSYINAKVVHKKALTGLRNYYNLEVAKMENKKNEQNIPAPLTDDKLDIVSGGASNTGVCRYCGATGDILSESICRDCKKKFSNRYRN